MMNKVEKTAAVSLAILMTIRMLGMFLILPVFTFYAQNLPHATPKLIGLALGIYGFTQACCQLPFGMLSDKWGRKKILLIGLVIFASGSALAGLADSIYLLILGRALQGAGAIGSVVMALLSDLTELKNRTKAMAIMGSSIGVAFAVAMVCGPILSAAIHVSGIFWLTSLLALFGIVLLFSTVPNPPPHIHQDDVTKNSITHWQKFRAVLTNWSLMRLNIGIFIQHAILTASFLVLPLALQHYAGLPERQQWYLYLPVLLVAYVTMVPFIILAEKKAKNSQVFFGAIFCILLSQLWLLISHAHLFDYAGALLIFFTAFTLLEAMLPANVSKLVPPENKGTAMGVYSTLQFSGIFFGGIFGGIVYGKFNIMGVFYLCALLALLWLLMSQISTTSTDA
jgi:MFS family permease